MNQEIKFRGKRVDNDGWVYGFFTNLFEESENRNIAIIISQYFEGADMSYPYPSVATFYSEVIPESVCQFTGLRDKNGKYIYEGDVITTKIFDEEEYNRKVIYFISNIASFCSANIQTLGLKFIYPYYNISQEYIDEFRFEIIGNIHDNPELLKIKQL